MIWNEVAGFVVKEITKKGQIAQENRDKFISSCVVSILENIDRFEPDKGFKLTTYLTPYIQSGIAEEFKNVFNTGTTYFNGTIKKVKDAYSDFIKIGHNNPTLWEITEITGLTPVQVESALDRIAINEAISLEQDDSLRNAESGFISPIQAVIENEGSDILYSAFDSLSPLEKRILIMRYNLNNSEQGPYSVNKIAAETNMRPDQVSTILVKCHRILRRNPALNEFFGSEYDSSANKESITRSKTTEAFFDEFFEEVDEAESDFLNMPVYKEDPISEFLNETKRAVDSDDGSDDSDTKPIIF